jgi:hypothetical protein
MWAGRGSGQRLEIKVRPQRSLFVQALLIVWRWRVELLALVVLLTVYVRLSSWLAEQITTQSTFGRAFAATAGRVFANPASSGALAFMLAVPALLLAIGPTRRYTLRHTWCTITRHRLRLFFAEADITNRSGRLPWIVHVRPSPVGERAWVWMAPGLSVQALEERVPVIASTCWARDARILATRRVVTLVRVDIVRRDPLETTKRTRPIRNRLVDLADRLDPPGTGNGKTGPTAEPGSWSWSLTPPGQRSETGPATKPTKPANRATAPTTGPDGPPVVVNGEDVSDYV